MLALMTRLVSFKRSGCNNEASAKLIVPILDILSRLLMYLGIKTSATSIYHSQPFPLSILTLVDKLSRPDKDEGEAEQRQRQIRAEKG